MTDATEKTVRIMKRNAESLLQSKDEEYACWQSRPLSSGWWPCRNSALLSSRCAGMKLKLDVNFCDLLSAFR